MMGYLKLKKRVKELLLNNSCFEVVVMYALFLKKFLNVGDIRDCYISFIASEFYIC